MRFLKSAVTASHSDAGQFGVFRLPEALLVLVNDVFEGAAVESQDDRAEALHEASVRVAAEARVAGEFSQTLEGLGVESEIQHGVHHSRHGHAGA